MIVLECSGVELEEQFVAVFDYVVFALGAE
jgi:hypothetical protein